MVARLMLTLLLGSSLALPAPAQDRPATRPAPVQGGGRPGGGPGNGRPPSGGSRPSPGTNRPAPNPGSGSSRPQPQPTRPSPGGNRPQPQPPRPSPGNRPNPGNGPQPGGPGTRPGSGHRPGGRPPNWGRPPQFRPSYHFRPSDRDFLRRHYLRHLAYINLARRPIFTVGGYIPYGDIGYLTPIPVNLYGSLPPIPPGYQAGYYDGYVTVYDPITYFIADLIDLVR